MPKMFETLIAIETEQAEYMFVKMVSHIEWFSFLNVVIFQCVSIWGMIIETKRNTRITQSS